MFNQDARHKAVDAVAAEQLISVNQAAARMWRSAADAVQTEEVKELFRSTAKDLEDAAVEIKKILPSVMV